jgi:hypothetical protein
MVKLIQVIVREIINGCRIEPPRKTIPDSIDCIHSHQTHNNILYILIK